MKKMTGSFKSLSDATQFDDIFIYSVLWTVKVIQYNKEAEYITPC